MSPTEKASWQLERLRSFIKRYDKGEAEEYLDSVARYVDIFRYHFATARDAMQGIIATENGAEFENLKIVFGVSENQQKYLLAKLINEAHVLGCLHATRSIYDVFAQLVNALSPDEPIAIEKCDVVKVAKHISDSQLKSCLMELISSTSFCYVSDFINTAKHRRLVKHGLRVSFEDGTAHITFSGFEYRQRCYEARSDAEVLQTALEVKNRIVAAGITLTAHICGEYL